jgi:hypothetical protein
MVIRKSGFVFAAKGIDASSLGMKVGAQRPDLLLLDDVEPDEAQYSVYQAGKRLKTITDAILPLNIYARVVLSGTVTMPGSVTHQLVRWAKGERDDANAWVGDEKFRVHHHLPIEQRPDGTERSVWPQKWPLPTWSRSGTPAPTPRTWRTIRWPRTARCGRPTTSATRARRASTRSRT